MKVICDKAHVCNDSHCPHGRPHKNLGGGRCDYDICMNLTNMNREVYVQCITYNEDFFGEDDFEL